MKAEQATLKVGRLAALTVSPVLQKGESDRLAAEWADDISEMRQHADASDADLVRMECQYVTWLAGHAQRYEDRAVLQRSGKIAEELLPRATRILTQNDANLLSLLNTAIQLHLAMKGSAVELAKLYDSLIPTMVSVHGQDATRSLLPEYATQLAAAKRHADAEKAIDEYLQQADGKTLPDHEAVRLNRAVDALAGWGVSHKSAYERLRTFRDAGRVTDSFLPNEDPDLANDQQTLQGAWVLTADPSALEMTIDGDFIDIGIKGPKGNVVRRLSARFVLSRSGACRLLTRYPEGGAPENGDAMIYTINGDVFYVAEGMLTGTLNGSNPAFKAWKRKAEN